MRWCNRDLCIYNMSNQNIDDNEYKIVVEMILKKIGQRENTMMHFVKNRLHG